MDRIEIIHQLLNWIEKNLDSITDDYLSLKTVAKKAGYSKWHLQRMFKEITGQAIGAYIRARRLSKSAVALRLTSRPILDIALQYRFDSQQTFTRAFKKQFSVTPATYRRSEEWYAHGICSPIRIGGYQQPEHEFITLPRVNLLGFTQSYSCSLEQISDYRLSMRTHFWQQFLKNTPTLPPVLYGLHDAHPSPDREDEQEVCYTTALPAETSCGFLSCIPGVKNIELKAGDYVKFIYCGSDDGLQDFIMTVYGSCMPEMNLVRRKSYDIELFYPKPGQKEEIYCEYLIPICTEKKLSTNL